MTSAAASIEEALALAIERETLAARFYQDLAARAATPELRGLLSGLATEELRHHVRLQEARVMKLDLAPSGGVADDGLGVADLAPAVPPSPTMTLDEALLMAMAQEKASVRLYTRLAERAAAAPLRRLFTALAEEETRHQQRLEDAFEQRLWERP